jgi:hypothetical protein
VIAQLYGHGEEGSPRRTIDASVSDHVCEHFTDNYGCNVKRSGGRGWYCSSGLKVPEGTPSSPDMGPPCREKPSLKGCEEMQWA